MVKSNGVADDSHAIQWSIQNFSSCTRKRGQFLECTTSTAEKFFHTRWTLVIYPRGKDDPNFLGCCVRRGDEEVGPRRIRVRYLFSLITFDGVQTYSRSDEAVFKRNSVFGFSKFVKLDDILCLKEFLLQSDTLTIRCTLQMLGAEFGDVEEFFDSEFPMEKLTTRLDVDNFRGTTKQNPRIFDIRVPNSLLSLKVSMNKDAEQIQEAPESFLHIVMTIKEAENPIHVSCWIKLLKNNMDIAIGKEISHLFSRVDEKEEWILPYFIDTDDLQFDGNTDVLVLEVELTVCDQMPLSRKIGSMRISEEDSKESTLRKDLEDLYTSGKFSDVILRVGNETFAAHKSILSSRSPRFEEIFQNLKKEETKFQKHIEEIVDVDKNTMAVMLKFIYTDTLEDMSDEKCLLLYAASQKYRISSLQDGCIKFLKDKLSINSVCKALVIAKRWNDTALKLVALRYILDNYQSVLLTPEWQTFHRDHGILANQVLRHVELKKKQQFKG